MPSTAKPCPGVSPRSKTPSGWRNSCDTACCAPASSPPVAQRELRALAHFRTTFIKERATLVNRVQKVLEDAKLKLAAVASNLMGVSGRAMRAALSAGATAPQALADLAKGRLRDKREQLVQALEGRVKPPPHSVLTELLCQIDSLGETLARFGEQIEQISALFAEAVEVLDTIPGVARQAAEIIG
jgi:transposase